MNTLIATLALAYHVLFMGCCVVAVIMLVGITMDAVNNLKQRVMSRDFKHSFNPFRGCSPDELVLAYCFMSDANDHEGAAMVAEAFSECGWI